MTPSQLTATVNVDAAALREFRKAVLLTRGRLYGYLGLEATLALRERSRVLLAEVRHG